MPVGALSGIAVIAVVLGATALSGAWTQSAPGVANVSAGPTTAAAATPMLVAAGSVGWVHTVGEGTYAYNVAALEEVCPQGDQPDCAALGEQGGERIDLEAAPKSVIGSPTDGQAIVVGQDKSGRQSVFVVSLPTARAETQPPKATPTPTPTDVASTESPATASTAPSATPSPVETPAPTPGETATVGPTTEPTQTAEPTPDPGAHAGRDARAHPVRAGDAERRTHRRVESRDRERRVGRGRVRRDSRPTDSGSHSRPGPRTAPAAPTSMPGASATRRPRA